MTFEMKLMDKFQEGLKLGQEQGLEQGRLQERSKQERINLIYDYLLSHNMTNELHKALNDPDYQAVLLEKYQDITADTDD